VRTVRKLFGNYRVAVEDRTHLVPQLVSLPAERARNLETAGWPSESTEDVDGT
jgi:hypothetical protein